MTFDPNELRTPSATIALRGGIAIVSVDRATGATEVTLAYGRSATATSKSTGETRTISRPGWTLTIERPDRPIAADHIASARLGALLSALRGASGSDGGATTLPDPNAPGAHAIDAENSLQSIKTPPFSSSARLGAVTTVTSELVAQTAQSTATGTLASLAGPARGLELALDPRLVGRKHGPLPLVDFQCSQHQPRGLRRVSND